MRLNDIQPERKPIEQVNIDMERFHIDGRGDMLFHIVKEGDHRRPPSDFGHRAAKQVAVAPIYGPAEWLPWGATVSVVSRFQ